MRKNSEKLLNFWEKPGKIQELLKNPRNFDNYMIFDEYFSQFGRVLNINLEMNIRSLPKFEVFLVSEEILDFNLIEDRLRNDGFLVEHIETQMHRNVAPIFSPGGHFPISINRDRSSITYRIGGRISARF